ncbi:hypothetical protein JX265_011353 [Neoarthrinium moseri]|uniref:Autophagy-related protein 14 n=1 Tax=Neoarthrinium moseri TaxID=1658444 RepID=A0A9P9WCU5_9PEZI|nr:hypothetical protein JX265_011353 [Neoarthrinium moseri]
MDPRTGNAMCDICQRGHHPQRLPFLCAMDARNLLYEKRIANAQVLIEMDELEQRVNALLQDGQADAATTSAGRASHTYTENSHSEEQKAKLRTEQIISAAEKLQKEVDEAKKEIQDRKAVIARRKTDLASASQGIAARRRRELEETQKAISMSKFRWNQDHGAMAAYRGALCAEVAKLYRLQRVRRGNPVRFEYKIGGLEIVDLHHLNSKLNRNKRTGEGPNHRKGTHPEHISASLGHIAHLLWLASHYLSIKLPAEITLPHNDYPKPTIFSLASSYQHGQVSFPGASPLPVDPLDRQYGHVPHPRPLFLDKPLSSFSKDESNNYTAFLEGVCLLAYNIVWLCRTQGVPVGNNDNSFEDFTYIGRNLYNLLIGSSVNRGQPPQAMLDANGSPARNGALGGNGEGNDLAKATPQMGAWSHGTAHTSLSSTAGNEFTRSFKLPNPIKLADKLKSRLANDAPVPEWELIEGGDFGPNDLDDGVFVGGSPQSKGRAPRYGLESYMSVNTIRSHASSDTRISGATANTAGTRDKERSSNGWTKIKPR